MSNISPLRIPPGCCGIYPFSFDGCFTLSEKLCKIQSTINAIIEEIANQDTDVYTYVDNAVANALVQAKNYTDVQNANVLAMVAGQVEGIKNYTDAKFNETNQYTNQRYLELHAYLDSIATTTTLLHNPVTGLIDNLQNILNDIYNTLNFYALTAWEYDNLELTAESYDDYGITAFEYDYFAGLTLGDYRLKRAFTMFHPQTGEQVFYKDVIGWLIQQHFVSGLTATQYDGKSWGATTYDGFECGAYNYDYNGSSLGA